MVRVTLRTLNESPSEKEGKFQLAHGLIGRSNPLNESPSEKEGKFSAQIPLGVAVGPSMKVPPKRKGNNTAPAAPKSEENPQ